MDFNDMKTQINTLLTQNYQYFATLTEFLYNQFNSESEQPTNDKRMNFQSFLHSIVLQQLDKLDDNIEVILDGYSGVSHE